MAKQKIERFFYWFSFVSFRNVIRLWTFTLKARGQCKCIEVKFWICHKFELGKSRGFLFWKN